MDFFLGCIRIHALFSRLVDFVIVVWAALWEKSPPSPLLRTGSIISFDLSTTKVNNEQMATSLRSALVSTAFWRTLRTYFGAVPGRRGKRIADFEALQHFLASRSSHVAQTALYGYLRTRAGTRFPELFDDDDFARSINFAKWHVWLACLSDLSVYAGGLLIQRSHASCALVEQVMSVAVEAVLSNTGKPDDAGPEFAQDADRVGARLLNCDWASVQDSETPFSRSPEALVHWAPVVDEFKLEDDEIVRNSVRFRWHEVRRDLRRDLDANALMASATLAREDTT